MNMGEELKGITVISFEQAVAAPYCGLLLAHAGARVIKIERKGGDFARDYDRAACGQSAYFSWLNRGKESIVLDIDDPEDRALMVHMLAHADIMLQNLSPGALDRRGFDGPSLRTTNQKLITCEISGYGTAGEYAKMKAYDLLVQAEAGLSSITGTPEGPARVGFSVCDIATGLTAYSGILRALLLRSRTGVGVDLSVSMFDVMSDWMNVPLLYQRYTASPPTRMGVQHPTLSPYGLYEAGDGKSLLIAIQSNREWRHFCERILGQPALADDQRFKSNTDRVANRLQMDVYIHSVFRKFNRDDLMAKLIEARIACAQLNSVADLDRHPQLRNNIALAAGHEISMAALPLPGVLSEPTSLPDLNADSERIRREFSR